MKSEGEIPDWILATEKFPTLAGMDSFAFEIQKQVKKYNFFRTTI